MEITDGSMKGNMLSLQEAYKKIEALETALAASTAKLTDYIVSGIAYKDTSTANADNITMNVTVPSGYKVLTTLPTMFVSGDSNAFVTDRICASDGKISCYVNNPNKKAVSVKAEVLFVKA